MLVVSCLLVFLAAACTHSAPGQVSVDPSSIRASWMDEGETAEFRGVLLSDEAFRGYRERIAILETELEMCREGE